MKYYYCFTCNLFVIIYLIFIVQIEPIDFSKEFILNNVTICLFLPSSNNDFPFLQGIISSIDTFWPLNIGKKIHYIEKCKENHNFKYNSDWKVIYDITPNITIPIMKQQYNSYMSYKYCKPNEYIAMIDSDAVFFSYAKYSMLFDSNKRPYMLYTLKSRKVQYDPTIILKTNNKKWGDSMITFPIIFKTKHLEELYRYIEAIHNTSLNILMNTYTFSQFATFLEYIHIKRYENQYSLVNVDKNPFPPRCILHIPYCYIEVNWGEIQKIKASKRKNIIQLNKLIYYLIQQGKCARDRKICEEFYEKKYIINSFTIEGKFDHFYKSKNNFNQSIYSVLVF